MTRTRLASVYRESWRDYPQHQFAGALHKQSSQPDPFEPRSGLPCHTWRASKPDLIVRGARLSEHANCDVTGYINRNDGWPEAISTGASYNEGLVELATESGVGVAACGRVDGSAETPVSRGS